MGLLLVVGLIIAWQTSAVVVNEGQQAVITEFGRPVRPLTQPGLYWRTPFIQDVTYFDKRLLLYDTQPTDIITQDKKTLRVDNYARWRIIDPIQFLESVGNERVAQSLLDDIIYSELRAELGRYDLIDVVASARDEIHHKVTVASDQKARQYGIEIIDVRIKRADLPPENQNAVFERMISERARQATQYRSEGEEEKAKIQAQTDKERALILAEARRKAEEIRGQGQAEAIQIYNAALSADPEFYAFIRSLEAYRKLKPGTRIILSPDSELFKYLRESR